jgi:hypothetical protein
MVDDPNLENLSSNHGDTAGTAKSLDFRAAPSGVILQKGAGHYFFAVFAVFAVVNFFPKLNHSR